MVCALFVMAALSTRTGRIASFAANESGERFETLTNQSISAYLVAGFHSRQNGLRRELFEWTKGQRIPSSIGSFSVMKTNSLIH